MSTDGEDVTLIYRYVVQLFWECWSFSFNPKADNTKLKRRWHFCSFERDIYFWSMFFISFNLSVLPPREGRMPPRNAKKTSAFCKSRKSWWKWWKVIAIGFCSEEPKSKNEKAKPKYNEKTVGTWNYRN